MFGGLVKGRNEWSNKFSPPIPFRNQVSHQKATFQIVFTASLIFFSRAALSSTQFCRYLFPLFVNFLFLFTGDNVEANVKSKFRRKLIPEYSWDRFSRSLVLSVIRFRLRDKQKINLTNSVQLQRMGEALSFLSEQANKHSKDIAMRDQR